MVKVEVWMDMIKDEKDQNVDWATKVPHKVFREGILCG